MLKNMAANSTMSNNKLWSRDFILGTVINFAIMTNYYCLMVVMANYAMQTYNASASVAGLVASIFIIGALVSRVVAGNAMDKLGRKTLLVITSVASVIFSASYMFGLSLPVLFVVRALHGFCYGAGSTTVGTIVSASIPNARKGEGIGYYMLSVTVGAAIGPFLGMFLVQVASYATLFLVACAIAVLNLIATLLLHAPKAKTAKAKPSASKQAKFSIASFIELTIIPLSATCAVLYFCYSSLLTFLTPYSSEVGLETASSFFFVVYAIATFVTRPFTGRALDKRGDKCVMLPAFAAFIVGMLVLANVHTPVAMLASAALVGFGVSTIQASALALCVRMAPDSRIALANSTFYMFLDIGVGTGPFLLGFIEPHLGYRGLFACMAVVALLAMLAYIYVGRRSGKMRKLLGE